MKFRLPVDDGLPKMNASRPTKQILWPRVNSLSTSQTYSDIPRLVHYVLYDDNIPSDNGEYRLIQALAQLENLDIYPAMYFDLVALEYFSSSL